MIQYATMQVFDWSRIEREQLNPQLTRQVIHGEKITVARLELVKGALVPLHSHANEQITVLERGSLRFVINGEEKVLRAGEVMEIPPHAPHSVLALEDSTAMDLFSPVREDWIRGDDAYLRNK
ncbi:MAG TPA: cupin domain-containing protein [Bryobacteraceae bacterium]|nr:cupin domain-containing protein [Bryobacteraceae bacterium]